jgi:hypothetical protein
MERQILWHHLDGHFIKMVKGHLQNNNSFYSLYYPCAANLEMPMPEHPDRDELSHDQVVAAQLRSARILVFTSSIHILALMFLLGFGL